MSYANKNNLVSLDVLIANFLNTFCSENTRSAYKADLSQFVSFCIKTLNSHTININQISEPLCFTWRHTINDLPNKTLSRKLSAITSFFKFCQKHGFISYNPSEFLQRPRNFNTAKTNVLNLKEIKQILEFSKQQIKLADIHQNSFQFHLWNKRYAVLYTLFTVGMRVEELCKLKCSDIEHIENQLYRLHLITKGNKTHSPIIHPKTAEVLLNYIKISNKTDDDSIFDNIHRSSIYHLLTVCIQKVGITKKVSPHTLRASLATHLHKSGVPLGQIKDLLNHKNIATTLIYTKISDEELQENSSVLSFDRSEK